MWAPGKLASKIHKYSYTIELIHKDSIIVDRIFSIQTCTLKNILKLNSFCCYWICSATNLGIHRCQLEDVSSVQRALFLFQNLHILEYVYSSLNII